MPFVFSFGLIETFEQVRELMPYRILLYFIIFLIFFIPFNLISNYFEKKAVTNSILVIEKILLV